MAEKSKVSVASTVAKKPTVPEKPVATKKPPAPEKPAATKKPPTPKKPPEPEYPNYVGVYVTGTTETAFFTILLPDNTCGRFMMTSPRDVFWMGFTTYKVEGDKLLFKILNKNPISIEEFFKDGFDPETLKTKKQDDGPDEFIEATLTVGKEFVQHGENGDTSSTFITNKVAYWVDIGGFEKLGDVRLFEGMEDLDHALEIKKLCVEVIFKYGNVFVWA